MYPKKSKPYQSNLDQDYCTFFLLVFPVLETEAATNAADKTGKVESW